jgi:hypothetical protein
MPNSEKTGWMKTVEVVKTIVEIIAIFVAGWWAYTRFIQEDTPSLVQRADMEGNVSWYENSKDDCEGVYNIEFQNIGKVPIEVARARVSAWSLTENESEPAKEVKLLDPLSMRLQPAILEKETDRIEGTYAPGEKRKNAFSFIVSRSLERRVLFKIDLWRAEDAQQADPYWYSYNWSWPCGEYPKTLLAKQKQAVSDSSKPGPQ